MMIASLLSAALPLCATERPLACNLAALTSAQRKEHAALTQKLGAAKLSHDATQHGYAFRLDRNRVTLEEVGRWIALEERCCPFFDFALDVGRDNGPLVLRLGGGAGVRNFIGAEFGLPAAQPAVPNVLDSWVTKVENLVVPAAEAMPEEKYAFAPANGKFGGVRTFAGQVKHLAAANYQLAAKTLGEQPPPGTASESAPESIRTKSDIVKYLRGSFALLHRAAGSTDAQDAHVIDALVHSSNHYGQIVEYLRMSGIVPPASR